jgi:hypothetical protein
MSELGQDLPPAKRRDTIAEARAGRCGTDHRDSHRGGV